MFPCCIYFVILSSLYLLYDSNFQFLLLFSFSFIQIFFYFVYWFSYCFFLFLLCTVIHSAWLSNVLVVSGFILSVILSIFLLPFSCFSFLFSFFFFLFLVFLCFSFLFSCFFFFFLFVFSLHFHTVHTVYHVSLIGFY